MKDVLNQETAPEETSEQEEAPKEGTGADEETED